MVGDINVLGVSQNSPPGVFTQLDFATGAASAPISQYSVLLYANPLSGTPAASAAAGTVYGPDTLTTMQTTTDIINLAGAGSPAHLMVAAFLQNNKTTPLYYAPVRQASGGTPSELSISLSTGSGQSVGVVRFRVDGKPPVDTVFAATDSPSTIASNMAANINGQINLPVVAVGSGATLVVSSKTVGGRTNWLRGFAQVISGSGVSVSVASPTFFSGGAGSDAANYMDVLNVVASNGVRYYYNVPEAGWDSQDGYSDGIINLLQDQVDSLALPAVGLRERVIAGSVDTLAHTAAVSTDINDPRLECISCANLDLTPAELAATWCSAVTLFETAPITAGGVNYDGFGGDPVSQPFWNVPAPLDGTAPSSSDIQTAVVSGVTILKVVQGGKTNVVKRCTSRFLTSGYLDLRITDAGVVTVCDQLVDEIGGLLVEQYPRAMIQPDPTQGGSVPPPPNVVTPSMVKNTVSQVVNAFAAAGVVNAVETLPGISVVINAGNPSSFGILLPIFTSNLAHQFLLQANQVNAIVI